VINNGEMVGLVGFIYPALRGLLRDE